MKSRVVVVEESKDFLFRVERTCINFDFLGFVDVGHAEFQHERIEVSVRIDFADTDLVVVQRLDKRMFRRALRKISRQGGGVADVAVYRRNVCVFAGTYDAHDFHVHGVFSAVGFAVDKCFCALIVPCGNFFPFARFAVFVIIVAARGDLVLQGLFAVFTDNIAYRKRRVAETVFAAGRAAQRAADIFFRFKPERKERIVVNLVFAVDDKHDFVVIRRPFGIAQKFVLLVQKRCVVGHFVPHGEIGREHFKLILEAGEHGNIRNRVDERLHFHILVFVAFRVSVVAVNVEIRAVVVLDVTDRFVKVVVNIRL